MVAVAEKKTPQWLHCECGHEWIVAHTPIEIGLMGRILKSAHCPMCGAGVKRHRMGQKPKPTGDGDYLAWLRNGDTGVSSETIFSVMTGHPVRDYGYPYDPADFGRCYRLLKVMPSWRARLPEVASRFPESAWPQLVAHWDELTALYEDELVNGRMTKHGRMADKTFELMQRLRGPKW